MNTDDFQKIKDSIDIVQGIERLTGQTAKKQGSGYELPECPFCKGHDCFKINPKDSIFNCFQCEKPSGGSIVDFVMKLKQCTDLEALEDLAEVHGIELSSSLGGYDPQDPVKTQILELAADYCHQVLMTTKHALTYQTKARGHDKAVLEKFRVGFTDGNLHRHLAEKGFTKDQMTASGLIVDNNGAMQDIFRAGQYIYPHKKKNGKIGDFTTKTRDKKSFRLRAEHKDPDCLFFNEPAFKGNSIILVEGQNDALSIDGRGECSNVAACCGQPSNAQADYLREWVKKGSEKTILLCFDNDPAGEKYRKQIENKLVDLCLSKKMISINKKFSRQEWDPHEDGQPDAEADGTKFVPVSQTVQLKKIRFDEKCKDIDDFLKNRKAPVSVMQSLIAGAEVVLMPLKRMIAIYRRWCDLMDMKAWANEIGEIIFDYFETKGQLFIDENRVYLFYRNKIHEIGSGISFKALLYEIACLNYANSSTRQIIEVLQVKAYEYGRHTQAPGWIHGEYERLTIYFNLNNDKNEILKLSPGKAEVIQNGTNPEKILLRCSPKTLPIEFYPDEDKQSASLLNNLFMKHLACNPSDRFFIAAMVMNTVLLPFTGSKGINKFSGDSSSGKSFAGTLSTILAYGQPYLTTSSAAASFSGASRNPRNLIFYLLVVLA